MGANQIFNAEAQRRKGAELSFFPSAALPLCHLCVKTNDRENDREAVG